MMISEVAHGGIPGILNSINPTDLIRLGVGACATVGAGVATLSGLYEYHDRKQIKNATLLKVLPKKDCDIKDTEKLIKNLHSMLLNTKFRKLKYGRPFMTFEIASIEGKISFYIWVPTDMKNRIVDRIYSTYPDVAIQVVDEYVPVWNKTPCYSAELVLAYPHILKIKTKGNDDILSSTLSGLKDLGRNEFAAIQIIVRPLDNSWQKQGRKQIEKFEKEGIRPGESNFGDKLQRIVSKGASEISEELSKEGIKLGNFNSGGESRSNKKSKFERKEIVVASEKLMEPGFETVIRMVALGKYKKGNTARIKALSAAFSELDAENRFKKELIINHNYVLNEFKNRRPYLYGKKNILTPSELSNIFLRFPGEDLMEQFREIERIAIKEFQAPDGSKAVGRGVVFAKNTYRGEETILEIKDKDIVRHAVIQGKTGSGKSEWMKTSFLDHIKNHYDDNGKLIRKGRGAMVLEPHGKLADELLQIIPEDRRKDVIVFDLFSEYPWPFNFCKVPDRESDILNKEQLMQKTVDEAIEIFKRQFSDVWSEKNEFYFINAVKAIIETNNTMLELPRMFSDRAFRESIIPQIKDAKVKKFWQTKFKANSQGKMDASVESTAQSVEYKLEKFLSSKELVRVLGQNDCIDFKEILDEDKIIIFKFSKDRLSRDRINFLGGIAIKQLIVAAFARNKEKWMNPFLVYIDEAQNFINESIKDVLYELRKYGIGLVLMHQELEQMNEVPGLISAIYNNVGTSITFTVGDLDAPFFAKKYGPRVDGNDLMGLPSRNGYCKLLVNGHTSETFNIYSLDSPQVTAEEAQASVDQILRFNKVGKMHIDEIDKMIAERYEDLERDNIDIKEDFAIEVVNKVPEGDEEETVGIKDIKNSNKTIWDD